MAERPRTFDEQLDAHPCGPHAVCARPGTLAYIASATIDYSDGCSLTFRDADTADAYLCARAAGCTELDAIAAALATTC